MKPKEINDQSMETWNSMIVDGQSGEQTDADAKSPVTQKKTSAEADVDETPARRTSSTMDEDEAEKDEEQAKLADLDEEQLFLFNWALPEAQVVVGDQAENSKKTSFHFEDAVYQRFRQFLGETFETQRNQV